MTKLLALLILLLTLAGARAAGPVFVGSTADYLTNTGGTITFVWSNSAMVIWNRGNSNVAFVRHVGIKTNAPVAPLHIGATDGDLMQFDPTNGLPFFVTHSAADGTNHVFQIGYNLSSGGGARSATDTAIGDGWEPDWYSGAARYTERHLYFVDRTGAQRRPWSWRINKDTNNLDWVNMIHASEVDFFGPTNASTHVIVATDRIESAVPLRLTASTASYIDGTGFLGVGTNNPLNRLHLVQPASPGIREQVARFSTSDAGSDAGFIGNATTVDGVWITTFSGFTASDSTRGPFQLRALTTAANDASDSAAMGMIDLLAVRTDTPGDPNGGSLTDIVNRKLFTVRTVNATYLTVLANGHVGFGTLSPSNRIDVAGNAQILSNVVFTNLSFLAATNGSANTNITVNYNQAVVDLFLTNNASFTNFANLTQASAKSTTVFITPMLINRTVVWPTLGGPSFGTYWYTNDNSFMWTTLTQGVTYALSLTTRGTNVHASLTAWK